MGSPVFPHIYREMIEEDIEWLLKSTKGSLYRDHIIEVLKHSADKYKNEYQKLMEESDS